MFQINRRLTALAVGMLLLAPVVATPASATTTPAHRHMGVTGLSMQNFAGYTLGVGSETITRATVQMPGGCNGVTSLATGAVQSSAVGALGIEFYIQCGGSFGMMSSYWQTPSGPVQAPFYLPPGASATVTIYTAGGQSIVKVQYGAQNASYTVPALGSTGYQVGIWAQSPSGSSAMQNFGLANFTANNVNGVPLGNLYPTPVNLYGFWKPPVLRAKPLPFSPPTSFSIQWLAP